MNDIFKKCEEILEDRKKDYGNHVTSFNTIASIWNIYLKKKQYSNGSIILNGEDVAMLMVMFKVCRELNTHKEDNIIDIINYLILYNDLILGKKDVKQIL